MKKPKFTLKRILLFAVVFFILSWIQLHWLPMWSADSAVSQLEDSDAAYVQFKSFQTFVDYYPMLYVILGILFSWSPVKSLYKNRKTQEESRNEEN